MKSSHLLIILFIIAIVGFVFYSLSGGQSDEGYTQTILKEREEKDTFMKGDESPFTDTTEVFSGLKYFAPDLKYRITANLEEVDTKKVVVLTTSDGKEQKYLEYA